MAEYIEYHPLKFWLDPASIAEIVAHIQSYLVANPINSTTEIETIIHDYLIAHPELIGGVDSVNGQTGEVVLTADNISAGENVTIKDVLDSLQDQIDDIVASIPSDYQQLIDDVSDLKSAIDVLSVSNNSALNQFFRELYLIGLNAENIVSVAINSGTNVQFIFYNSSNTAIASFVTYQSYGDIFVTRDTSNDYYMYAYVDWSKLSAVTAARNTGTFNTSVNNLEASPNIEQFATHSEKKVVNPSYTKTTSKRISTTGKIVSAGSSWFYTSPIHVYSGDVVYLRSLGASSAAPISYTDSEGSKYTMAVQYGGSDPSEYYLPMFEDGYIAVSGYADTAFRLVVYQNSYVKAIVDALNQKIENGGGSSGGGTVNIKDILKANNHDIHIPNLAQSAEISKTAWDGNGASIGDVYDVYDEVNNVKMKAIKVTSNDGSGIAYCDLADSVDATKNVFVFSLMLDPDFDVNTNLKGRGVNVTVYSDGKHTSDYRWTTQIQSEFGTSSWDPSYARNGWWHMAIAIDSVENATVGNHFDFENVTAVGIQLRHDTSVTRSAYIAEMGFAPKMKQPGIITIIDNFDPDVPDMADYANSKGITLNLSIIPGFYAGASGAPTCAAWSEVERIAGQGHFIWNHTWTHQFFNDLTENQIFDQVDLAESWMNAKGYAYSRGSDFVSVPSVKFNTASYNALIKTNAKMIFHKWMSETTGKVIYVPYYPALRQLPTTMLDTDTSGTSGVGTALATAAAKAITYGGIAVIGFHGTFWERDNGVSWKGYIDAIAELNCRHYTLEEIYKGMWN